LLNFPAYNHLNNLGRFKWIIFQSHGQKINNFQNYHLPFTRMNHLSRKAFLEGKNANATTRFTTGLELEFLGTSSARPTHSRNVTSIALNFQAGGSFLFDCGEGTSRQMLRSKCRVSDLEAVFITHLHGDHFYGLPGLAMRLIESRKEDAPTQFIGPKGLLRCIGGMVAGRRVEIRELTTENIHGHTACYENDSLKVTAYFIEHSIFCVGYIIEEKSSSTLRLDRELIEREYGLGPCALYRNLAAGQCVTLEDGRIIDPSKVSIPVGEAPRKVVILGDTCNPFNMAEAAHDADVLVHEATCSNADRTVALSKKHSTSGMAGAFAKRIAAKNLILTHFSPRETLESNFEEEKRMDILRKQAIEAFESENVHTARDFWTFDVPIRKFDKNQELKSSKN
jgi:ribonuclease Z